MERFCYSKLIVFIIPDLSVFILKTINLTFLRILIYLLSSISLFPQMRSVFEDFTVIFPFSILARSTKFLASYILSFMTFLPCTFWQQRVILIIQVFFSPSRSPCFANLILTSSFSLLFFTFSASIRIVLCQFMYLLPVVTIHVKWVVFCLWSDFSFVSPVRAQPSQLSLLFLYKQRSHSIKTMVIQIHSNKSELHFFALSSLLWNWNRPLE